MSSFPSTTYKRLSFLHCIFLSPLKWKSLSCVWLFVTPWTPILCPWDSPGKNNGVDCHFLLQRIFLTQGLNWVSCITGKFFIVCPPGKPKRFLRPLSSLLFFEAQEDRAVFCVNTLCVLCLVAQSCLTLCNPMDFSRPWNSPGQNTGVGSLSLLQGIFPTQGSNPGLLHCRQIL